MSILDFCRVRPTIFLKLPKQELRHPNTYSVNPDHWEGFVEKAILESPLIIIIGGYTKGLRKEIGYVIRNGKCNNLLFLFPPISDNDALKLWRKLKPYHKDTLTIIIQISKPIDQPRQATTPIKLYLLNAEPEVNTEETVETPVVTKKEETQVSSENIQTKAISLPLQKEKNVISNVEQVPSINIEEQVVEQTADNKPTAIDLIQSSKKFVESGEFLDTPKSMIPRKSIDLSSDSAATNQSTILNSYQQANGRNKIKIKNIFGKIQCFEIPERDLNDNWQNIVWYIVRC